MPTTTPSMADARHRPGTSTTFGRRHDLSGAEDLGCTNHAARRSELATPPAASACARKPRAPGRSGVSRPGGRMRAPGQGVRPQHRGRAPSPSSTGAQPYGGTCQWPRNSVVSRRYHRTGQRRPRQRSTSSSCPRSGPRRDVWWVDVLLVSSRRNSVRTPDCLGGAHRRGRGSVNVAEIARASPRLAALIFGAGDLSASPAVPRRRQLRSRGRIPRRFLARFAYPGAGRRASRGHRRIDAPYPAYRDIDGYRRSCDAASLLGSTASGQSIRRRCPSPMRCSHPHPKR